MRTSQFAKRPRRDATAGAGRSVLSLARRKWKWEMTTLQAELNQPNPNLSAGSGEPADGPVCGKMEVYLAPVRSRNASFFWPA